MIEVTEKQYQGNPLSAALKLRLISTFSDPDGTMPFGYGCPAMDTDWGIDGKVLARCEMRMADRHQKKWDCKFFLDESLIEVANQPQGTTTE